MKKQKGASLFCTGLILGVLLSAADCSRGPSAMGRKKYAEGFSVDQPAGWEAKVSDKKNIFIAATQTTDDPGFVLVTPFFIKAQIDSLDWLKQNIGNFTKFFSGSVIEKEKRLRSAPDESAVRFRFERNGKAGTGLALCSIQDRSGIVYIAGSSADRFDKEKSRLIAILESFRFEQPESGATGTARQPAAEYTTWQDPRENAFSLEVPKNWKIEGGTFRRASVDLVHTLLAASPDGRMTIRFNDPNIPLYAMPNQMLAFAGLGEGRWYSPGYGVQFMVMRYLPGVVFLDEYLKKNFAAGLSGFQVVNRQDRPDISQEFNRIYSSLQSYGMSFTMHAGEEAFRFEQSGTPFVGYGFALTQVVEVAAMRGGGNWAVAQLIVTASPEQDIDTIREIAGHMFQTWKMNPQWEASQQQLTANVSHIVTQTNQEITKIIDQSYWSRQNVMDNVNRKFSNYILGVTDVVDPETGEKYKVEAGHNYYWRKDFTNQVAGTRTADRPDINFTLLKEF